MPRRARHGFTLVELSVVIAIIAVIAAGTFSMGGSMVESARRVSTQQKLDAIETALMAYRIANNRLPCPSDPTLTDVAAHSATYGYETGAAGTCADANGVSYTIPTTSTDYAALGMTVAEGALPVKTLGLPDEFQFDGWGRKFAYAVATPMTGVNAFVNYGAGQLRGDHRGKRRPCRPHAGRRLRAAQLRAGRAWRLSQKRRALQLRLG